MSVYYALGFLRGTRDSKVKKIPFLLWKSSQLGGISGNSQTAFLGKTDYEDRALKRSAGSVRERETEGVVLSSWGFWWWVETRLGLEHCGFPSAHLPHLSLTGDNGSCGILKSKKKEMSNYMWIKKNEKNTEIKFKLIFIHLISLSLQNLQTSIQTCKWLNWKQTTSIRWCGR